ncbi:MAG TPA: tripartite tricarboxylate transporter substrate binding protein [Hydrogenophaga sp.]
MFNRRNFSVAMGALALGPLARAKGTYPERPITLVVPFSAGSVADIQARVIARVLSERLGQPIVINNRIGVSGSIGADFVARAEPDGYTLLVGTQGTQGTNSALYKNIRYDPVKDFVAIHGLSGNATILVVNPARKFASVADLVKFGKENPGKLNFGSGGGWHLRTPVHGDASKQHRGAIHPHSVQGHLGRAR